MSRAGTTMNVSHDKTWFPTVNTEIVKFNRVEGTAQHTLSTDAQIMGKNLTGLVTCRKSLGVAPSTCRILS